jgi:uncharacterized protein YfcZ (UPF0381/DUF406 family)
MSGGVIAIILVLIVIAAVTASTVSYFRLQRHRADAVAMAGYRKLAEQAVSQQAEIAEELAKMSQRLAAVESLLRSVE